MASSLLACRAGKEFSRTRKCGTSSTISAIYRQRAAWVRRRSLRKKMKSTSTCMALLGTIIATQSSLTSTEPQSKIATEREPLMSAPFFILAKRLIYLCSGGVGVGVGLGVVSVAGAVSVAGVGAGVGVGVAAGGFTGAGGRELGAVEDTAVLDGATSVPAACFTAARNFSADCGGGTEPVRIVLKSIWRP